MKTKVLPSVFLGLCLLLTAGINCFAQAEAAYKIALSKASVQKNPSEYRAQALKQYIDSLKGTRMSERQLNQHIADKWKELMSIDFYAAVSVRTLPRAEFLKWGEVQELVPAEQVAAIKKLNEYCAMHNCPKEYPAGFPKPGSGWAKTNSGSVPAPNPITAAKKPPQQPPAGKPSTSPLTVDYYTKLAFEQMKQRKFNESIQSATECLRLNNEIFDCYFVRGAAYFVLKNYDASISDLTQSIKLDPKSPEGYESRAHGYREKANYTAALDDFNMAIALYSSIPEMSEHLSEVKIWRNQTAVKYYFELSFKQLNQGRLEESIKSASECLKIDEKTHGCYQLRASAYLAVHNFDAAISDFTHYIQLQPKDPQGYVQRGETYAEKKNYEAAVADFTTALGIKYEYKLQQRLDQVKKLRDAAKNNPPQP